MQIFLYSQKSFSKLIAQQISSDGESNWVEGLQLSDVYTILGILFCYLLDAHHAVVDAIPVTVAPHH